MQLQLRCVHTGLQPRALFSVLPSLNVPLPWIPDSKLVPTLLGASLCLLGWLVFLLPTLKCGHCSRFYLPAYVPEEATPPGPELLALISLVSSNSHSHFKVSSPFTTSRASSDFLGTGSGPTGLPVAQVPNLRANNDSFLLFTLHSRSSWSVISAMNVIDFFPCFLFLIVSSLMPLSPCT